MRAQRRDNFVVSFTNFVAFNMNYSFSVLVCMFLFFGFIAVACLAFGGRQHCASIKFVQHKQTCNWYIFRVSSNQIVYGAIQTINRQTRFFSARFYPSCALIPIKKFITNFSVSSSSCIIFQRDINSFPRHARLL